VVSTETTDTAVGIESTPSVARPSSPDQLLVVTDPSAQGTWRLIPLDAAPIRVGRGENNNVVFSDASVSGEHARLERMGANWALSDVGSRHGTFVNEVRLEGTRILRPHDKVRFGRVIVAFLSGADVETARIAQIAHAAEYDALTGLRLKQRFLDMAAAEVRRATRHGRRLSLLMLDIDHFKRINDRYGHPAGDSVLAEVGRVLQTRMREYDLVARYGGEEFVILLPEADLAAAKQVAESLRETVAAISIPTDQGVIRPTISCGAVALTSPESGVEDLVRRADAALYEAKQSGRNRVVATNPDADGAI
jgi:two-component system cell cycle response regulator